MTGITIDEEETTKVELSEEQLEAAQRMYLSEIMRQLTESERFNRFFKINYEVQTYFDKDNMTYDIRLIERTPEMAAQYLRDLTMEHAMEHTPSVVLPTPAEVAAIKKDLKKK
jgi:hypothetical protein